MNHVMWSPNALKVFDFEGTLVFKCEARNDAVAEGYGHDGRCPPGEYKIGEPQHVDPPEVPFGSWFVPVLDPNGLWNAADPPRAGIGIHGGGSGLPAPFAPRQGWQITDGCFRLQNVDLEAFVQLVEDGDRFTVEQ